MQNTDFFNKHWAYIQATAKSRAAEIAGITGNRCDIDDYCQDIYTWIFSKCGDYDQSRGKPTTYIAMLAETAKKRILRRLYRKKNAMLQEAKSIDEDESIDIVAEESDDETSEKIEEYIELMQEPARTICRDAVLNNRTTVDIAREQRISIPEVETILRLSLRPVGIKLGIIPDDRRDDPDEAEDPSRYYPGRKSGNTSREVPSSGHKVSFCTHTRPKDRDKNYTKPKQEDTK